MTPTTHTALGAGGEFDRLRRLWARLGPRARGLGDDCALVTVGAERLALSCDASLEGQHFERAWLTAEEIGWRAGAAALSDLAAMAAEPLGILTTIGVAERDADLLDALGEGLASAAAAVGAVVWGGDLVASDVIMLDVFVLGRADQPVERRGARVGDGLWVTGRLGAPDAALRAWRAGRAPEAGARHRFAHPEPRVREARWLRDQGATAMIDLSDGLTGDAGHLAAASGVGLTVTGEAIPLHPDARDWERAAAGGEEYELLVTLPPTFGARDAATFGGRFGLPLTRIGEVMAGSGVVLTREGAAVAVPRSFSHFAERPA